MSSVLRSVADGVRVAIRLTPRAGGDHIDGIVGASLKVSVAAPPVDDRANAALLRLLARAWRLPRRDFSLIAGHKSRDKIVHVAGDPAALVARLDAALAAVATTAE